MLMPDKEQANATSFLDVFFQHFHLENVAEFSQCFHVGHVNDQRSKPLVEDATDILHQSAKRKKGRDTVKYDQNIAAYPNIAVN